MQNCKRRVEVRNQKTEVRSQKPEVQGRSNVAAILILMALAFPARALPQDARVTAAVKAIDAVAARGPFRPSWESLEHYQVPQWYLDAKFGIFIHWGVYSVPAFGNE